MAHEAPLPGTGFSGVVCECSPIDLPSSLLTSRLVGPLRLMALAKRRGVFRRPLLVRIRPALPLGLLFPEPTLF